MKKIKLFSLFAAVLVTTSTWATLINGIDYTLNDGSLTATVTGTGVNINKNYSGSNLVIPATVTYNNKTYTVNEIGYYAFQNNTHITSVTLPGTITSSGSYVFYNCTSLTQVVIEEGFNSSVLRWFNGCSSLLSISVPGTMKFDSQYTFDGCSSLRDVYVHWTSLNGDEAQNYTFGDLTLSNITLHVPAGTVSSYAATSPWDRFNIVSQQEGPWVYQDMTSGMCSSNKNHSISYNNLNHSHFGEAEPDLVENSNGLGFHSASNTLADYKMCIYSLYSYSPSIPSYAKMKLTWNYQIRSHLDNLAQQAALYAHNDVDVLKAEPLDFTYNNSTDAGSAYRIGLVNHGGAIKDATESFSHDFYFDNHTGSSAQTKSWYLILTQVLWGGGGGPYSYDQWATFKSVSYSTTYDYYKHITFDANGGSGSMEAQQIENSGTLTVNSFTYAHKVFNGWSDGVNSYADGAEVTATADSKGPVMLYAQWIDAPMATLIAPTAVEGLEYTGGAQELIHAGSSSDGEMQYSLDNSSWSSSLPSATAVGIHTVYYRVVADDNHIDNPGSSVEVTINKAALSITADNKSITYGDAAPSYTVTYNGWVNGETESVLGGSLAFACDYEAGDNIGDYTITPSGVTASNYTITFHTGTLTVNKADAAILSAPTAISGLEYTGKAQTLITAGSATGGELQYKLNDGAYSTALPQATDEGNYTVYYKVVGDANHSDIVEASIAVSIAAPSAIVLTANPDPDPQHAGDYYSTFYHSAVAYELSAGVEAYVAKLSADALILTKIAEGGEVIPMDNAVILKSNSGAITLTPSDATPVSFEATNNLHGVDAPTAAPANCYVLSGHSSDNSVTGVGFYQYISTLKAHKAYAVIDAGIAYAPKKLRFVFNQEQTTTDVDQITNDQSPMTNKVIKDGVLYIEKNGVRYNAQGQIIK